MTYGLQPPPRPGLCCLLELAIIAGRSRSPREHCEVIQQTLDWMGFSKTKFFPPWNLQVTCQEIHEYTPRVIVCGDSAVKAAQQSNIGLEMAAEGAAFCGVGSLPGGGHPSRGVNRRLIPVSIWEEGTPVRENSKGRGPQKGLEETVAPPRADRSPHALARNWGKG